MRRNNLILWNLFNCEIASPAFSGIAMTLDRMRLLLTALTQKSATFLTMTCKVMIVVLNDKHSATQEKIHNSNGVWFKKIIQHSLLILIKIFIITILDSFFEMKKFTGQKFKEIKKLRVNEALKKLMAIQH